LYVRFGKDSGIILKNCLIAFQRFDGDEEQLKKEVSKLERKTKILTVSVVLALAILSGMGLIAYAYRSTNGTDVLMAYGDGTTNDATTLGNFTLGFGNNCGGMHGFSGGPGRGGGRSEFITVSQEFKDNVINIAENDSDVQNLLTQGYNVTNIIPMISTTVEGNGTVTMKATSAVVTLSLNTTSRAIVWVDLEQAKVTRIEILSITVIDKS
jgi:hypothetical protein